MKAHSAVHFHDVYRHLLQWLLTVGAVQDNKRTGHKVKVGRGGTSFRVELSDNVLPTVGLRRLFPRSAAAEVAWFLSGEQDVTWLRQYAPMWDKFVEDDRRTVLSAYGHRWRTHFKRDQIDLALRTLEHDPSDRRVYLSAWDPATDGLGASGQRNVPCPTSFNLYILDGELHSALYLRSSDVFVGLPYDVMGHALLMDAFASTLRRITGSDLSLGVMHVTLGHAHLYEDHWDMAQEALNQAPVVPELALPNFTINRILVDRDDYVQHMAERAKQVEWPSYSPRPFVVE